MNIFKRIRNLWLLSNFSVKKNDRGGVDVFVNTVENELDIKPRMAQIIRRTTPVEDFLKENNE